MATTTITEYGPGGFDPSKPNNNVVNEYEEEVPRHEGPPTDTSLVMALALLLEKLIPITAERTIRVAYLILDSSFDEVAETITADIADGVEPPVSPIT